MGACEDTQSEVRRLKKDPNNHQNQAQADQNPSIPFPSFEKQMQEFPDFPEWEGEKYKGIGIKRQKGYKCNLPVDKLTEQKDKFWQSRIGHNMANYKIWRVINQACVFDEYRANVVLEKNNLTTAEGCVNHIIDKNNNHYWVPNYCINDPYYEKEYLVNSQEPERKINIKLTDVSKQTTENMCVSNKITGKILKDLYIRKCNIGNGFKIRLFFSGNEITDEHFLYQYNLQDGFKVQVMKIPII